MEALRRRLAVARGDEPADLVVRGGRVLSVFTKEWLETDVAVVDGVVAGLGEYDGREVLDASGSWVVPGFIDAHMHLESTKLLHGSSVNVRTVTVRRGLSLCGGLSYSRAVIRRDTWRRT